MLKESEASSPKFGLAMQGTVATRGIHLTLEEAKELALVLQTGALPVELVIVSKKPVTGK